MNAGMRPRYPGAAALWRARSGIAALEFALAAPVLILLFTGVISLGLGLRTKMEVENAARAGATYASSHPLAPDADIVRAAQSATVLATDVTVTLEKKQRACMNSETGTVTVLGAAVTCAVSGAPPGTYVTVTTTLNYTFIMPMPGMEGTTILRGKSVARLP